MPMHKGLLPREGFKFDTVAKIVGNTALNPIFMLPLILLARYTKKGEKLAVLHPTAYSRAKLLLYLGLLRFVNSYFSRGVLNNWKADKYNWSREVVVITGGSAGIGMHVVKFLSELGIKVVVLDIQPLTYEAPPSVHFYKCDITSPAQIAAVAKEIRAQHGYPTVLINNAGVARGKSIMDSTEKDVRFTFEVNTFSHYWLIKEFLPSMIEANHGMIVTVASYASWVTVPNMVDYAASKAAAQAFHEGLTAELRTRYRAPKVRTVLVNQGYTKTPLFEGYFNDQPFMNPALEPESVAERIVRQVLSGKSGQIVMPAVGNTLSAMRALPHWLQNGLRAKGQNIMPSWRGRQVVSDLDEFFAEKERDKGEVGESTVLVPGSK